MTYDHSISQCSVDHNKTEIGMCACVWVSTLVFDHLRILNARKHDNSVYGQYTRETSMTMMMMS